jgi:hypothetical protein
METFNAIDLSTLNFFQLIPYAWFTVLCNCTASSSHTKCRGVYPRVVFPLGYRNLGEYLRLVLKIFKRFSFVCILEIQLIKKKNNKHCLISWFKTLIILYRSVISGNGGAIQDLILIRLSIHVFLCMNHPIHFFMWIIQYMYY